MVMRTLVLSLTAICLVPLQAQEPSAPRFEVASVRRAAGSGAGGVRPQPDGITASDASLTLLLRVAYDVQDYQIVGPDWLATDHYDIVARAAGPVGGQQVLQQMLRSLLADRFKMVVHREQRPTAAYALVKSAGGPRLTPAKAPGQGSTSAELGRLSFISATMPALARRLSQVLHEPVVDATELPGAYDFVLEWQQDDLTAGASLSTAVQEQLGLKLERRRMPIDVVVVDGAERTPTEN